MIVGRDVQYIYSGIGVDEWSAEAGRKLNVREQDIKEEQIIMQ
jgi:hypothetical protein